ncbi:MAG: DNA-3-methyladenine glycosylase 2 family protein [Lachnospiraceae bacterium]|nr:DNA-3-methyladenine glycosylase 2 family protein [Lachnospiraceae bacterium]
MVIKSLDNFDPRSIAESGQCFRMNRLNDRTWRVIALGKVLDITELGAGRFGFDTAEKDFNNIWKNYFDLETDYSAFISAVPPEDEFLKKAAAFGRGIRILRQEPFETLITFIISQRKNIPAIKKSVELLSGRLGKRLGDSCFSFPSAEAIAGADPALLAGCSLGYRTEYVQKAAQRVADGEISLSELCKLNDEELRDRLLSFYGVGTKVANCVMLFSYHRIAAFPVDVWIGRVIDRYYSGRFPLEKYEGFAGIIQQYMFYYGRLGSGSIQ